MTKSVLTSLTRSASSAGRLREYPFNMSQKLQAVLNSIVS